MSMAPKRNFLRRTKATAPPDTTETEASTDKTETATNKFNRRGINKFTPRKELEKVSTEKNGIETASRRPSFSGARRFERPTRTFARPRTGGANGTSTPPSAGSAASSPSVAAITRRPFRIASRRRPSSSTVATAPTTTVPITTVPATADPTANIPSTIIPITAVPTTATLIASSTQTTTNVYDDEESLQDIGDIDVIEDPSLEPKSPKNNFKIQRRPLVNLKDQNPSATNEEESKRQSKKYSASIKQNQLDDLLKVKSQEESTTESKATSTDELSSETAVALAAHQLITAPLPIVHDYDEDYAKPTRKTQTTVEYKYTSREYNEYTGSQTPGYDNYQSTPVYRGAATYEPTANKNVFDSTKDGPTDFSINQPTGSTRYVTTPNIYRTADYAQTTSDNTYSPDYEGPKISTSTYDFPKATNYPNTANTADYIRTTNNDYSISSEYDLPKITPTSFAPKSSTNYPTNTATNDYRTTLGNTYDTQSDFDSRVSSYLPKATETDFSNTAQEYRTTGNTYPDTSTEYISKISTSYVPRFPSISFSNTINQDFRTTGNSFDTTPTELNSLKISTTLSPPPPSSPRFSSRTSTFASTLENSARTATSFIPKTTETTKYSRNGFSTSLSSISSPDIATSGYTGVLNGQRGSQRFRTEKLIPVPVDESYSTVGYTGSSQEPSHFTREYLLESPVTKTYDEEYQYLSPITTPSTPVTPSRKLVRKKLQRKISTTQRPTSTTTTTQAPPTTTPKPRGVHPKPFEKVTKEPKRKYRPIANYDYYDDSDEKLSAKYAEDTKVVMHENGNIECLDIGNFPHPTSCKKFISCARIENGSLLGWEYICPKGLSFDPVGGICNWSAGLGCNEKDV